MPMSLVSRLSSLVWRLAGLVSREREKALFIGHMLEVWKDYFF